MADYVKTVLREDGKLVAYWQRSVGRPWIAVREPGQYVGATPFSDQETALSAARAAREAAFEKERADENPHTE